ncbi:hypothetical protein B0H11DRAFT_2275118 [Mycena galericulata]|nr:hypothetical protein B0H11DRAFT_2275118 [Mycena galericulata]
MWVSRISDALLRANRFQVTSNQDKIRKALNIPTKSDAEQRAVSFASEFLDSRIYDGLPSSPYSSLSSLSDSGMSHFDSIEITAQTPIGLGLLDPSPRPNELPLLSPLELLRRVAYPRSQASPIISPDGPRSPFPNRLHVLRSRKSSSHYVCGLRFPTHAVIPHREHRTCPFNLGDLF